MSYEKLHFIINPASGGGSAGKVWAQARGYIESVLGTFSYEFTGQKGHAIELSKRASGKSEKIVGIGGDGTISEIVTGILQSGKNTSSVGILNLGTGGDLCRTLGIRSNMNQNLARLKEGIPTPMDVGRISYQNLDNTMEIRYFINITGCGMAGEVVRTINRSRKLFGSFSYYISSVQNLLSYKNKNVQIYIDNAKEPLPFKIVTVAVANGRYFGGGMQVAPEATLNDGKFHVTVIGDWNLFEKILYSSRLYGSQFLKTPGVQSFEAKKITILPAEGESFVYIDSDGEDVGVIPMTVEILPASINLLL